MASGSRTLTMYSKKLHTNDVYLAYRRIVKKLIKTLKSINAQDTNLPFAVYSCKQNQLLRRLPIFKPVLVLVLEGAKEIIEETNVRCSGGELFFLAGNSEITLNNITQNGSYLSLMIEFEQYDFDMLAKAATTNKTLFTGIQSEALTTCISQYVQ